MKEEVKVNVEEKKVSVKGKSAPKQKTKEKVKRRSKKEILKDITLQEKLALKFPEKSVRVRILMESGGQTKELSYLPGDKIIERLNECFDGKWSFSIQDKIVDVSIGHVAILGRLEVVLDDVPVVKEQWGSSVMSTFSNGKVINLGNDIKAATTDSLKKCATLLGVGLYLYADDDERGPNNANYVPPSTPEKEDKTLKLREEVSAENKGATKAQVSSIMKIASDNEIDISLILKKYGVEKVSLMKKSDAANFIVNSSNIVKSLSSPEETVVSDTEEEPKPEEKEVAESVTEEVKAEVPAKEKSEAETVTTSVDDFLKENPENAV